MDFIIMILFQFYKFKMREFVDYQLKSVSQ